MQNQIEILIEPEELTDLVIELSQADGIEAHVEEQNARIPADSKQHGAYLLDTTTMVTVIVGVSSVLTSTLALAKALLEYLTERKKSKGQDSGDPSIRMNTNIIIKLSASPSPEEIAKCLRENQVRTITFVDL